MLSSLRPALFLISLMFVDDKSNWRATIKMKFILVINIICYIDGPILFIRESQGKEPPIQESCSRSNIADAYFLMMGKRQKWIKSMENPSSRDHLEE